MNQLNDTSLGCPDSKPGYKANKTPEHYCLNPNKQQPLFEMINGSPMLLNQLFLKLDIQQIAKNIPGFISIKCPFCFCDKENEKHILYIRKADSIFYCDACESQGEDLARLCQMLTDSTFITAARFVNSFLFKSNIDVKKKSFRHLFPFLPPKKTGGN